MQLPETTSEVFLTLSFCGRNRKTVQTGSEHLEDELLEKKLWKLRARENVFQNDRNFLGLAVDFLPPLEKMPPRNKATCRGHVQQLWKIPNTSSTVESRIKFWAEKSLTLEAMKTVKNTNIFCITMTSIRIRIRCPSQGRSNSQH